MTIAISILKAYFVGSFAVASITAFSVLTKALIIIVLLIVFFGVDLFMGPGHQEFLADTRVAGSVALGVL